MKTMYLLFSHTLTPEQEADAKKSLEVERFVYLPQDLQKRWSVVPPDIDDVSSQIDPIKSWLKSQAKQGDIALVQGEFGATCHMVKYLKALGVIAVYATTKRVIKEEKIGDTIQKISYFKHVRFRRYE